MTERTHEYHAVKRDGCRVIYITKAEAEIHVSQLPLHEPSLLMLPGRWQNFLKPYIVYSAIRAKLW